MWLSAQQKFLRAKDRFRQAWAKHPRQYKTLLIIFGILYTGFAIFLPGRPQPSLGHGWVTYAPSAAQVFKDFEGWNEISTPAQQAAAFKILRNAIQTWTGVLDTRQMSPRAAAKFREYAAALGREPYGLKFNDGACKGEACIRWRYYQKQWEYSLSLSFTAQVLQYFPLKYKRAHIQASKTPYNAIRSPVTAFFWGTIEVVSALFALIAASFLYILLLGATIMAAFLGRRVYKKFAKKPYVPPPYIPKPMPPPPQPSTTHGSATFAARSVTPNGTYATYHGVFLGKSSAPAFKNAGLQEVGAPVVSLPNHHTLIVARTRTGKGTRVIVPTLLRYGHNAFVIDPKGENAAITARTRRGYLKQMVHIVNPWGQLAPRFTEYGFQPATYNPLDCLDRNDPNVVATAQRLAHAICPVSGHGDDMFWQYNAATLLAAVFLWLTDQPGETKTLARAREIVTLSRREMMTKFLTRMATSSAFDGAIREMVGNFIDLADRTFTGITANVTMATTFISDPQLKAATNASSFAMSDLRDKATTIYLVIPPEQIDTQKTWLRLMITAATQSMRVTAPTRKTARRCMMLIDEFPALGRLHDLPTDIATMAGYGLDYTLIVQGIDQIKAIYEKSTGAILNNCAYKWFCNLTDFEGAKYLSDTLGEATIVTGTTSSSRSHGSGGHGNPTNSTSDSTSTSEKGRRLLTPDEILALGREVAICLQPEGRPLYLKPIDYWNVAKAFGRYQQSHPPLYWDPPTGYDRNPYVG